MAGVRFQASFRSHSAEVPAISRAGAKARFNREVERVRAEMGPIAAAHPSVPEDILPDIDTGIGGSVDTRA